MTTLLLSNDSLINGGVDLTLPMIKTTAFYDILGRLGQLSEDLNATNDHMKRLAILKQMRLLIADLDKIIESEMGEESP